MKKKYNMSRKQIAIIIFIVAFVMACLPSIIRWQYIGNPSIIGVPTTMHTRISEYMISGNFTWRDPLSFGGRDYTYPPFFSIGLAGLALVMPIQIAGVLYVSFFGGLAAAAVFLILDHLFSKRRAWLAALMLMLTPGFIFMFCHVSTRGPPLALALMALYFLVSGKDYWKSGILLGVAGLFHFEVILVFGVVFLLYSFRDRRIYKILIIAAVITLLWYISFLIEHGLPQINGLHEEYRERRYSLESPTLDNYFFEIYRGGYLTFPLAALALVGFFNTNTKKKFLRKWALFIFVLTLVAERFFVYLPIFMVFLAAEIPIFKLEKKLLKILLILGVCYLAFFGAAKVMQMADDYPKRGQYEALQWIKNNTPQDAIIFSDWQWGHWISGISERKNFMDGYAEYAPNASLRLEQMKEFFVSCKIPSGYGISYIYMEQWFADQQNTTCLGKFTIVYDKDGIEIYKV